MYSTQKTFIPKSELRSFKKLTHGGMNLKKRRKVKRPLIPGAVTHTVMKSSKAEGSRSFYKNKVLVRSLLQKTAKKYFIDIQDFVNMGNHLHVKAKFKDPKRFQNFLRVFSGLLARKLSGAEKGKAFGKFWDGLAYTRVLLSRIEELGLKVYFEGNHRERELGRGEREFYLKSWNRFLYRLRATRAAPA